MLCGPQQGNTRNSVLGALPEPGAKSQVSWGLRGRQEGQGGDRERTNDSCACFTGVSPSQSPVLSIPDTLTPASLSPLY